MRTRIGTIHIVVLVALAVGAAAGWFAASAWREEKCLPAVALAKAGGNVELWKCGNVETANVGRARSPVSPERSEPRKRWLQGCAPTEKAKPRRKALIRSSADAEVQKRILENKISYLEKCIAAAKGADAKPAEKKSETKAELIERLMKLPTDTERYFAFTRLDEKTQRSFTIGELRELCPKQMTIDDELSKKFADCLDKITVVAARRIGVLDTLDQSGLNDDERKVHAEFMDCLAECPDVFADMIDQRDSMTWGEVNDRIGKTVSTVKRWQDLVNKERKMLVEQVIKGFAIPEGDAGELRSVLDDVCYATSAGYFEKKD